MSSIAFDLSAIFVGAANDTPRGIDRVDMGWAKRLFMADEEQAHLGLLPSLRGMGVMTGPEARSFAAAVEQRWRENSESIEDGALTAWLRRRLAGERPPRPARRRGSRGFVEMALRYGRLALAARRTPLRPAPRFLPQGAIYLNTGQLLLGYEAFFEWLADRPDVKPVFLMHDLIPIFYPEYCDPRIVHRHRRALATIARHAAGMIATSEAAAAEIRQALKSLGRSDLPIHVVRLPVDEAFLANRSAAPYHAEAPYFVAVGAIDPRKNHTLLLNVWRELARALPAPVPKLVIVGPLGRRSETVLDFVRRAPGLQDCVIVANGLSTPAMRELIRDARALLTPSFSEGYGLPIVEALTLGTPVIASDIPAHREVGDCFATYIDPLDGCDWAAELLRRARETPDETQRRRDALASFCPQTWSAYFDEVRPFVESI